MVGVQPTWEACKLNKDKNRYNNIVACKFVVSSHVSLSFRRM